MEITEKLNTQIDNILVAVEKLSVSFRFFHTFL